MKHISLFLLVILSVLALHSCTELPSVEPSQSEIRDFQRQVRKSMIKAVQSPGIDNGSLLVVTVDGDTLIAPKDSLKAATPTTTIYMDLLPPRMPKVGMSRKTLELIMVLSIVGMICMVVLIVVIGVFRVMLARQRQRNKIISEALEAGVELPESFYTGQQSQGTINYTIINGEASAGDPVAPDAQPLNQIPTPQIMEKKVGLPGRTDDNVRQIRQGIILIGVGLILGLGFAAADAAPVGIIAGGCMVVVGIAKLTTIYLSNKL